MRNEMGFVYCRTAVGQLVRGPMAEGTRNSVTIDTSCPPGTSLEGFFHTHPGGVNKPSHQDVRAAQASGVKNICIDADGRMQCYRVTRPGRRR